MDLSGSWSYIERIARNRLANNKTPHHVTKYGEGIELLGVAGEIVARRFLGLNEILHEGFDNGIDLSYLGKRIDVKATELHRNFGIKNLQWPESKRIKCDIVLLTGIDVKNKFGAVIGYAPSYAVKNAPVNYERAYPCHEIPISELIQPYMLLVERLQ
jgi:hypothetical protein